MKLNIEQRKYIADVLKIIAIAQFAVIGYSGFVKGIASSFVGSGVMFAILVYFGMRVLEGGKDE
ncbi:hypothetical protein [Thiobacillus sp.]|uniref:hypothetical protein n=1 Tax=Thiobacillus sp. TaxID=924 RepID=UPI0011D8EE25|nr:hypothetical protein [Thiobacillus sp.]TXH76813.1 MAG: hypothetical protein E6Q82_01630 [Thiobacillus sp.]